MDISLAQQLHGFHKRVDRLNGQSNGYSDKYSTAEKQKVKSLATQASALCERMIRVFLSYDRPNEGDANRLAAIQYTPLAAKRVLDELGGTSPSELVDFRAQLETASSNWHKLPAYSNTSVTTPWIVIYQKEADAAALEPLARNLCTIFIYVILQPASIHTNERARGGLFMLEKLILELTKTIPELAPAEPVINYFMGQLRKCASASLKESALEKIDTQIQLLKSWIDAASIMVQYGDAGGEWLFDDFHRAPKLEQF